MAIGNTSEKKPGQKSNGTIAAPDLAQQVQSLNQRVAVLEKELAASQRKCGEYRQFVRQWALAQHTPEELRQWATNDDESDCLPMAQFVGELEAMVRNGKNGG